MNMQMKEGGVYLLVGPNGCGKTTLVNCISGIYTPNGGNIYYRTADISGEPMFKIAQRGLVRTFQIAAPFLRLTTLENMLVAIPDNAGENIALSLFRPTWAGRALMCGADTILLDEPVGSIDPKLCHQIFNHVLRLRDELGITFLVIEHRLEVAAQYADHVFAMDRGSLLVEGTAEEVFEDPRVIASYLGE